MARDLDVLTRLLAIGSLTLAFAACSSGGTNGGHGGSGGAGIGGQGGGAGIGGGFGGGGVGGGAGIGGVSGTGGSGGAGVGGGTDGGLAGADGGLGGADAGLGGADAGLGGTGGSTAGTGGSTGGSSGQGGVVWRPTGSIPPAAPTTYACTAEIHVATTGDDTAGDGTSAMPYKTIGKATSMATAPGNCVEVHAGTYMPAVTITFPNDGASGSPIVLRSADGKGMAVIDGSANTTAPTLEVSKDYVVVDGFEFKNTSQASGIFVVRFDGQYNSKCNGSVLRNSKLSGGFSQLKVYQKTSNVLVENNEFTGQTGNSTASLTGASGLVFRANYVHDINTGDLGTVILAGGSTGATFEKNLFQDITSAGAALAFGDTCGATCDNDPNHYAAVNALARNNIFIRANRALDVMGCQNCSLLSNSIIDAGASVGYVFRIGSANTNGVTQPTTGLRIIDNLLASPFGMMGYVMDLAASSSTGLNMDYNLFYNGQIGVAFGQTHPATADTSSVQGDPLFVSQTDLRPGTGSPAIGAGTNLVSEVPQDFMSVARPASGPFDIGALQH